MQFSKDDIRLFRVIVSKIKHGSKTESEQASGLFTAVYGKQFARFIRYSLREKWKKSQYAKNDTKDAEEAANTIIRRFLGKVKTLDIRRTKAVYCYLIKATSNEVKKIHARRWKEINLKKLEQIHATLVSNKKFFENTAKLPDKYKHVLHGRLIGLQYTQIAKKLQMHKNNVRTILRRTALELEKRGTPLPNEIFRRKKRKSS